jgi:hypothetical protein
MLTRALEISTSNCDSCSASVVCSPSTPSTRAGISSSSTDRSRLSMGCGPRACSSASIASCTSRFVSYRKLRIWLSSNVLLRLMSCFNLELGARVYAGSAWMRLVTRSMRTLPRVWWKAANPSSHEAMAPSMLSSSLSRARSCYYNSTACADVATLFKGEDVLHQSTIGDQHHDKKQAQAIADAK